jgi:predicted nucleotidyltransferase
MTAREESYDLPMSMTALDLSAEALKKYDPLEAVHHRTAAKSLEVSRRRRRASLTARKAAELLRSQFAAIEVFVFGSLARRGAFTPWSDVVLAAKGIPSARFFEAVDKITGLSAEFRVDLLDRETCPPAQFEM